MSSASQFSLSDLAGFSFNEYSRNLARYREDLAWFSGSALDEQITSGKKSVDKYPIRVNPIYNACLKHASALFGEFPDDVDGPLVLPRVLNDDGTTDERTNYVEAILQRMLADCNAGAMMLENGIISQIHGGCVFRLAWDPTNMDLKTKIRVEAIHPSEFVGLPYEHSPWLLREAWMVRRITQATAGEYGVEISGPEAYYTEHWTPFEYEVSIDSSPIGMFVDGEYYKMGGQNPFGFVPFVYIPHVRYGGKPYQGEKYTASKSFYGDSLIRDAVKGICREINARLADAGDAVSDDTHSYGVMSDVRGMPSVVDVTPSLRVINIGSAQAVMSGEAKPRLEMLEFKRLSEPVIKMNEILYNMFRREVLVPAVADGEDEGSQRSSLTLTTRMWPLVSHVKQERVHWSTGLRVLARMALKIMQIKGVMGITLADTEYRIAFKWYPQLPRDRESLMNELTTRAAVDLGSIDHLLELTGDVENVEDQKEKILAWKRMLKEIETEAESELLETQSEADLKVEEATAATQVKVAEVQAQAYRQQKQSGGKNGVQKR